MLKLACSDRFRILLSTGIVVALLALPVFPQDPVVAQGPAPDDLALKRAALAGPWTLHPYREGTPPPPPPPFSSQRSEQDQPPPLESVARANFRVQASSINGTAVFPDGIVLTDENQDVTGRTPVTLENIEFDGKTLQFQAMVEGKRLEATLEAKGSRFFGKWRIAGEDLAGELYLVRRR